MTEQDISSVPGNPEPGPDNFDFEAWLEGEATFPVFTHTAYLNQLAGAELARVEEELEELASEQMNLDKRIEVHGQQSATAFVDIDRDRLLAERDQLEAHLVKLTAKREELREAILKSAITFTFQVKTPEELGRVTREATRKFHQENTQFKGAKEDDLDYITARSRYMLAAQIAHFCTEMLLHKDGRRVPPPSLSGANAFLGKLISSEMMRLMEAVGTGLNAAQDWADKIDAGFPGGGSDVEEVRLDQNGAEGGEVLGLASADDADGRTVGLV